MNFIYVWPHGIWCEEDELEQMTTLSDDYAKVEVKDDEDPEDAVMRFIGYWPMPAITDDKILNRHGRSLAELKQRYAELSAEEAITLKEGHAHDGLNMALGLLHLEIEELEKRRVDVFDHFDVPLDVSSDEGQFIVAAMNHYIQTGDLSV